MIEVVRRIMEWWRESGGRDYPWRRENGIYESIVAEILLTRTKRRKVAEVYQKFLKKFPNPKKLAESSEDEIKKVVSGLGLEKRAKTLKKLGAVLSQCEPKSCKDFEKLPGIGPYGAEILSLKIFGEGNLPVDKVIARIISRLFLGREPKGEKPEKDSEVLRKAYELSELLEKNELLEVSYAFMDFGDEICKPRKPNCWGCPVSSDCPFRAKKASDRS